MFTIVAAIVIYIIIFSLLLPLSISLLLSRRRNVGALLLTNVVKSKISSYPFWMGCSLYGRLLRYPETIFPLNILVRIAI